MVTAFEETLEIYLRARFGLIVITTQEEERAAAVVAEVVGRMGGTVLSWDFADGLQGTGVRKDSADPIAALDQIDGHGDGCVFVLKDVHEFWTERLFKRKLKSLAQRFPKKRKAIVAVTSARTVPAELRDEAVLLELPSPDTDELNKVLETVLANPRVKVNLTELGREKIVQAALGLSAQQAFRVFNKAVLNEVLDDRDIELVTLEKKQVIRESQALEYYSATETPADVGGLEVLKNWLNLRDRAFTKEARDYGLPAPRGIALIGIPGTGKSLTAKMIGSLWRVPVIRLDIGALFGSLLGESEERTRQALRMCETIAPCVVWIDEIEKGLSQGDLDGGASKRVYGTILTWMQEKTSPCFVVATANNVSAVPPELFRKGRFDEVFFLDLPTGPERYEIIKVHLAKRGWLPRDFAVDELAESSAGRTGAELEQAIVDAMYVGFSEGRPFTSDDILAALRRQVPLSTSQREVIGALRLWLQEGRAQSASFAEAAEAEAAFVPLDFVTR